MTRFVFLQSLMALLKINFKGAEIVNDDEGSFIIQVQNKRFLVDVRKV